MRQDGALRREIAADALAQVDTGHIEFERAKLSAGTMADATPESTAATNAAHKGSRAAGGCDPMALLRAAALGRHVVVDPVPGACARADRRSTATRSGDAGGNRIPVRLRETHPWASEVEEAVHLVDPASIVAA